MPKQFDSEKPDRLNATGEPAPHGGGITGWIIFGVIVGVAVGVYFGVLR